MTIDLWSTALTFERGHRIAVHISSSNYPRFEVNPNTGEAPGKSSLTPNFAHESHPSGQIASYGNHLAGNSKRLENERESSQPINLTPIYIFPLLAFLFLFLVLPTSAYEPQETPAPVRFHHVHLNSTDPVGSHQFLHRDFRCHEESRSCRNGRSAEREYVSSL